MLQYIKKNKSLFLLSIGISAKLLAIFIFLSCKSELYSDFLWLSINPTISKNIKWSFLDFLWKSGESMNIYGNISRLIDYNHSNIENLIILFFTNKNTNIAKNSLLIEHFKKFNLHLQLTVATLFIIGILSILNFSVFIYNLSKFFISSKKLEICKLLTITSLNLLGFFIFYKLEDSFIDKEIKFIQNLNFFEKNKRLRNIKHNFDNKKCKYLIEINNLHFHKNNNYILKNINLKIKKGTFNIIIGPNGSGKTTLIKCLINLNENREGEIFWNGIELKTINKTEFARYVSYIPQFLNLQNSISIIDFLKFARYPYRQLKNNSKKIDREIIIKAIEENGCVDFINKSIDELSGGQKQKILLTSVLAQEAEVIVLDEPTSFLDIKNQYLFLESLKEMHKQGKTIIMILHNLQYSIDYADNLIILKDGNVKITGHPSQIINTQMLKEIFRINCEIQYSDSKIKIKNINAI